SVHPSTSLLNQSTIAPFFGAPIQSAHALFLITENPAYFPLRPKTRKRIRIPQPPTASRCSCHPSLMPNTTPPKCKIPLQSPGLWSLQPLKSPTRFYEDPISS